MKAFEVNPCFQYVFVHLTNRCNLSCSHCYVSSSPDGEFGLDRSVVKNIIDSVANLEGSPVFVLSGGEPFSRKKDCLEVLEYASTRVNTKLFTNGTLFNTEIAGKLALLKPEIRISIDGSDSTHNDLIRGDGSFVKILNGIEKLFAAGFPRNKLSICATLVEFNTNIIKEFLVLARNIGVESVRFNALCRRGRGGQLALNAYGKELDADVFKSKQVFSTALSTSGSSGWIMDDLDDKTSVFSTINIYANGSVFPYIPHNHMCLRPHETCAGNVNESSLDDIIKSESMRESILKKFLAYSMSEKSFSRAYHAKFINA